MSRTLKVDKPHQTGSDVRDWQQTLNAQMKTWGVSYRVDVDGDYGLSTRDLTATVLYGLGIEQDRLKDGVTPALRVKVRNKRLTVTERARYVARAGWRKRLKARHASASVASPVSKILQDSWGYHPGVHDGEDLICPPNAPLAAICDGVVIDVRSSGWWGLGAHASGGHAVSEGDGIIQIRCTTTAGPFKPGLVFAYGHAEHATVKVGDTVKAGQHIGQAGFANAWHVHFMVHDGTEGTRGVGDRDPRPFVDYARSHG